jgi:hypothetical protein
MSVSFPQARHTELLVQPLGDEVVIYDRQRNRAHRLNRSAALLWRACDGQTSVSLLATHLEREAGLPADQALVRHALGRMHRARLLERADNASWLPDRPRDEGRRATLKRIAMTGALVVAAPVVTTMIAPTSAMAQSLVQGTGCCADSCSSSSPCKCAGCSQCVRGICVP